MNDIQFYMCLPFLLSSFICLKCRYIVECLLTANNSEKRKKKKKRRKNHGKSDPMVQPFTDRAATDSPVEGGETSLDEGKWSTPLYWYSKNEHQTSALTNTFRATLS